MKPFPSPFRPLLTCLMLAACQHAALGEAIRDITTPEQMDAKVRAAHAVPKQVVPEGEVRKFNKIPGGILEDSQLIAANGQWAIVPKGAVLFVPPSLKTRLVDTPSGTLVQWSDFLLANRQWLGNLEISVDQASGKDAFKPEAVKHWSTQNKILVATHQGGPISCKTPTPPKP